MRPAALTQKVWFVVTPERVTGSVMQALPTVPHGMPPHTAAAPRTTPSRGICALLGDGSQPPQPPLARITSDCVAGEKRIAPAPDAVQSDQPGHCTTREEGAGE